MLNNSAVKGDMRTGGFFEGNEHCGTVELVLRGWLVAIGEIVLYITLRNPKLAGHRSLKIRAVGYEAIAV